MNDFPKQGQVFDWLNTRVEVLSVAGEGDKQIADVKLGTPENDWLSQWDMSDWLDVRAYVVDVRIKRRIAPSTNAAPALAYKAVAVSNDVTTCECCGRENLAKTVVIQTIEDGAPMGEQHYGVVCAAKLTGASRGRVSKAVRVLEGNSNAKPWALFA